MNPANRTNLDYAMPPAPPPPCKKRLMESKYLLNHIFRRGWSSTLPVVYSMRAGPSHG